MSVEPKKWLNRFNRSTGCARPVEDRLREAKKFLSLPMTFSSRSRLNLNRLRSSRGPVEAQRSLFLTANRPVKPPTASLTFFYSIKRIQSSLFKSLKFLNLFLIYLNLGIVFISAPFNPNLSCIILA